MEADLYIDKTTTIKGSELSVTASRASGPGGQHVNKTSSKVSLRWNVKESLSILDEQKSKILEKLKTRLVGDGELLIHVESERSQHRNREIARARLKEMIIKALVVYKKRVATKPTLGSKQKRMSTKLRRGILKKLRQVQKNDFF